MSDLIALADSLGVVYWIDTEAIADQLRTAIRQEMRHARATEMRDAGISWKRIASDLDYASDGCACSAVTKYCKRAGRPFPAPPLVLRAPSRARGERAYVMRCDGYRWREIAAATGYRNAGGAMAAMQRYCAMMDIAEPLSFNLDGLPRRARLCSSTA